jgi:hypothetical protein
MPFSTAPVASPTSSPSSPCRPSEASFRFFATRPVRYIVPPMMYEPGAAVVRTKVARAWSFRLCCVDESWSRRAQ